MCVCMRSRTNNIDNLSASNVAASCISVLLYVCSLFILCLSLFFLIIPNLFIVIQVVKYKQTNILLFIRTPIIYFFINLIFQQNNVFQTLIYERWLLFIYKTILSIYYDDYNRKKDKYIRKYNLIY